MYQKNMRQLSFEDFYLPFGGKLNPANRWIRLEDIIPWEEFEDEYAKNFSKNPTGCPAKSVRIALGALIIKERLNTTDEEAVELIRESPYLQFFLGLGGFSDKAPFEASMYVHFRKRFSVDFLNKINERIVRATIEKVTINDEDEDKNSNTNCDKDSDDAEGACEKPSVCDASKNGATHKGKLLIDATCTPADIHFPTDINVLNSAREKSEEIIDVLYPLSGLDKKPRTYRKKARSNFLSISMSKRSTKSQKRKARRKQLGYLRRNLKHISKLAKEVSLTCLSRRQYKNLLVIHEVLRQQQIMHDTKSYSVPNRIVSVSQPHVRPIVRGKLSSKTEFGAKISTSLVDGFSFLDRINWEAYNETVDMKTQINLFYERFGVYPESIHADKIYRSRKNRDLCKGLGIKLNAMPLGRPTTDKDLRKQQQKDCREDDIARIPIEGKYGESKRKYSLNRIMAKLASTSEATIGIVYIVMNLEKYLRDTFFALFLTIDTKIKVVQSLRLGCSGAWQRVRVSLANSFDLWEMGVGRSSADPNFA